MIKAIFLNKGVLGFLGSWRRNYFGSVSCRGCGRQGGRSLTRPRRAYWGMGEWAISYKASYGFCRGYLDPKGS